MEAEALMARLQELLRTVPNFGTRAGVADRTPCLIWTGKLDAILHSISDLTSLVTLRSAVSSLNTVGHERAEQQIHAILHRVLAAAELRLPNSGKNSFIAVGHSFDALAAIADIISQATSSVMLVDPYMSEKTLTTYCVMARPAVSIRLLTSAGRAKPGLVPAATAWIAQYGDDRPLVLKGVRGALLHDRFIVIDEALAWNCTQSFDAIAERSAATINKSGNDIALDQIAAFSELFIAADTMAA